MITTDELKKMSDKEIDEEINKTKLDLLKMRLLISSRQSKETSKLKLLRKYVARMKTLKRMRELEVISEKPKTTTTK